MIYTFYSFKGGVGRSMALANLAELFVSFGLKVLMIDFDLEAPGLERYFVPPKATFEERTTSSTEDLSTAPISAVQLGSLAKHESNAPQAQIRLSDILAKRGVIDLLLSYKQLCMLPSVGSTATTSNDQEIVAEPLSNFIVSMRPQNEKGGALYLMPAGRRDHNAFNRYTNNVQSFDWDDFYTNQRGTDFFDWFRAEAENIADVILVDSRTGVTEMGGICTHHIADCVLLFVGANQQNLEGSSKMIKSLSRKALIEQRGRPLSILPIPSRIENAEAASLNEFARQFKQSLQDCVPPKLKFDSDIFVDLKIPYVPYYAFEERVATREPERESAKDLIFAFNRLASVMAELAPGDSLIRRLTALSVGKRKIPQNILRSHSVHLIGRARQLQKLRKRMQQSSNVGVAIIGMGGVGKTELARQYALEQYEKKQYPGGLCWLKARDQDIAEQIVNFAQIHLALNLPEVDLDGQVQYCWQHWPTGKVLIIVDDVTSYDAIAPYLPPLSTRFRLLITTRLNLATCASPFPLTELDPSSSTRLLSTFVGSERIQSEPQAAQKLCQKVGYLPLALELLGAFLTRKPDWSISALLERLEDQGIAAKPLAKPAAGMTSQVSLPESFKLSWQSLTGPEQTLACFLSLFATAPIAWNLVETCVAGFKSEGKSEDDDLSLDNDDIEDLRDDGLIFHSLLTRHDIGFYQLHPTLQAFFRIKLKERPNGGLILKQAFCNGMIEIAKIINSATSTSIRYITHNRYTVEHLKEMVALWSDHLSDSERVIPIMGIGRCYEGQGQYQSAEPWYQRGLNIVQHLSDREKVANGLNTLAAIYYEQEKYDVAEPLFKDALKLRQKLLGDDHPDVAATLNNLAILYSAQSRYDEAEALFTQAISMRERLLGYTAPDVAVSWTNLATLYNKKGEIEKAEQFYQRALDLYLQQSEKSQEKLPSAEEHPHVATILHNLAELYRVERDDKKAADLYRRALSIRKRLLGNEHPDVITTQRRLQTLYIRMREKEDPGY